MYSRNRYNYTKKGKNWNDRKRGLSKTSQYNINNDCFGFISDKSLELEQKVENNSFSLGLDFFPCIYLDKEQIIGNVRDYFEFRDYNIFKLSLEYMFNLPSITQDIIIGNQYVYNTGNIIDDIYNSIIYRYKIETASIINPTTSMALSFIYQFPNNIIPDPVFYKLVVNSIIKCAGFKDRTMLIRTDIVHNRILFIMSNITNESKYLEEYHNCYDMCKKYTSHPILFTKSSYILFSRLDNLIYDRYLNYMSNLKVNIYIKKKKD